MLQASVDSGDPGDLQEEPDMKIFFFKCLNVVFSTCNQQISQYANRWHLKQQSYSIMHVRMAVTLAYFQSFRRCLYTI